MVRCAISSTHKIVAHTLCVLCAECVAMSVLKAISSRNFIRFYCENLRNLCAHHCRWLFLPYHQWIALYSMVSTTPSQMDQAETPNELVFHRKSNTDRDWCVEYFPNTFVPDFSRARSLAHLLLSNGCENYLFVQQRFGWDMHRIERVLCVYVCNGRKMDREMIKYLRLQSPFNRSSNFTLTLSLPFSTFFLSYDVVAWTHWARGQRVDRQTNDKKNFFWCFVRISSNRKKIDFSRFKFNFLFSPFFSYSSSKVNTVHDFVGKCF